MAALALQLSCSDGDDCRVIGPAGSFASALGGIDEILGASGGRPMGQTR